MKYKINIFEEYIRMTFILLKEYIDIMQIR